MIVKNSSQLGKCKHLERISLILKENLFQVGKEMGSSSLKDMGRVNVSNVSKQRGIGPKNVTVINQ